MSLDIPKNLDIPGILYSAALVGGGLAGFIRKGSIMSGVAGGGLGTLAAYGAYQVILWRV